MTIETVLTNRDPLTMGRVLTESGWKSPFYHSFGYLFKSLSFLVPKIGDLVNIEKVSLEFCPGCNTKLINDFLSVEYGDYCPNEKCVWASPNDNLYYSCDGITE